MISGFFRGLVYSLVFWAALVCIARAQTQRTTCYDSGNTRICETFDGMGNPISKSRCYQSGRDTRCETSSSSGTTTLPIPVQPRKP